MKPYGLRHKKKTGCYCSYCLPVTGKKLVVKRRARAKGKEDIKDELKELIKEDK